jgi:hypothetical protein
LQKHLQQHTVANLIGDDSSCDASGSGSGSCGGFVLLPCLAIVILVIGNTVVCLPSTILARSINASAAVRCLLPTFWW